ncbi:3-dehydroquinate synthase [Syntrophomonas wolfei]|jgi:3-dehydroquinate synthase|uniref:3-dehydroquinate synthase n=1 Tax=Syntrophomonas wolfei TaxID=863 RepID=UPI0007736131|nr:3-dehydroquinate synthase [Syntrophomonas wolfei]
MDSLRELEVSLGERSYPIYIEGGSLKSSGVLLRQVSRTEKILLVSNPTVFTLYGLEVQEAMEEQGFSVSVALMPDGEQYKNQEEAFKVLDQAVEAQLERSSVLVALGGGVVGDLAGLVAALYQRGIDYVQIPTTLLSQVDSSVGGKVAINHPRGKNLMGAFHQPRMVIIDYLTLATLDKREYKSGLAEVVKYGIIHDIDFFDYLESHTEAIKAQEAGSLEKIIYESCRIKSEVVAKDERETGLRTILNLGHTFGHSLEKLGNYSRLRHGEAVAMGTIAASFLAREKNYLTPDELERIIKLYQCLGIPTRWPDFEPPAIYEGMLNDKKVINNKLRLVLPRGIGNFVLSEDISREELLAAIRQAQSSS